VAAPSRKTSGGRRAPTAHRGRTRGAPRITPDDFDAIAEKLKLLEFGLYGLQEAGRVAPVDADDLGPFVRLSEEIGSDVEALRARLAAGVKPGGQG
jgi:hypothetical protein